MTFADLYHLDKQCRTVEERVIQKDICIDEEGYVELMMTATTYEDLKDIVRKCKHLVYDLCQIDVKDVIKHEKLD